ncbi:hypothetical protein OUZ56_013565 [Daphnia magna]|uniref:Uncharacterized protein n=1 Tax=Daphnia magna TaxID=35525 RepID=A0ABQ9Z7F9_9CRUS|nr:hypothetical protein OUZ56_013565 [Daphnia magna]
MDKESLCLKVCAVQKNVLSTPWRIGGGIIGDIHKVTPQPLRPFLFRQSSSPIFSLAIAKTLVMVYIFCNSTQSRSTISCGQKDPSGGGAHYKTFDFERYQMEKKPVAAVFTVTEEKPYTVAIKSAKMGEAKKIKKNYKQNMKAVLISLQTKIKNKEDDWHAASRNGSCTVDTRALKGPIIGLSASCYKIINSTSCGWRPRRVTRPKCEESLQSDCVPSGGGASFSSASSFANPIQVVTRPHTVTAQFRSASRGRRFIHLLTSV